MKSKERPVIVTTEFRGVFFGYATSTDGDKCVSMKREIIGEING